MPLALNSNKELFLLKMPEEKENLAHFSSRVFKFKLNKNFTLLLNSLSGAVDVVNKKELLHMKEGRIKQHARLYSFLKRRKYLFASPEEEEKYFQKLCDVVPVSSGMGIYIFVTSYCNFSCPYCFEEERTIKNSSLDMDKLNKIFDSISKIRQATNIPSQNMVVKIFGGEPLLPACEKIVLKILEYCKTNNHPCTITTNGYTLGSFIDSLKKYKEILQFLHISLDGPPEIHNKKRPLKNGGHTFDKIVNNINDALDQGFPILLRTNLDKENFSSMRELINFYIKMGWHKKKNFRVQIIPVFDIFGSRHSNKLLYPQAVLKKISPVLHLIKNKFYHPPMANFSGSFIGIYLAGVLKINTGYQEWPTEHEETFFPQVYACLANQLRDLQFLPDGKIYPCIVAAGKPKFAIGEYYPSTRFFLKKCENWERRNISNIQPCNRCSVATFCGGGCVLPSITKKEINCNGFKEGLIEFLKDHRKHIIKLCK